MKHLMPNDMSTTLVTKFHEVLAVILKGVIKGLRTGLATCRFLYIASIGSAPSISLYGKIATLVSKMDYSLGFRDIRYWVAINLVRLEAMWFLVTNKRYPKNVRQQINCNSCK
jgi:hypothetical protein